MSPLFPKSRLVGLLLTIIFLALAFSRANPGELLGTLRQANYLFVLPAALVTLCGYLLRTLRWETILADGSAVGFRRLFSILMIGFATNNLLPARLGEFVRAVLLRRQTGLRKTYSLATIFLERLFDGLVLIALLSLLSLGLPLVGFGQEVQLLASLLFLGATAGLVLLLAREPVVAALVLLLTRPLPARAAAWVQAAYASFLLGVRSVRRPGVLSITLGTSLGVWLCEGLAYYCLTYAFDFPLDGFQRLAACGMLLVFINLGIMIPSAPGYVGTFQFFAAEALAIFQVPRELALSLSIVAHAQQYILVTAIGAFFVMREHLSWGSLANAGETDESRAAERLVAEPVATGLSE